MATSQAGARDPAEWNSLIEALEQEETSGSRPNSPRLRWQGSWSCAWKQQQPPLSNGGALAGKSAVLAAELGRGHEFCCGRPVLSLV